MKKSAFDETERMMHHLMLNAYFIPDIGFFRGQMGLVLAMSEYFRYANNEIYFDVASYLLDNIMEKINDQPKKTTENFIINYYEEEKIIITIGRPTKQKGVFELIEAMRLVLKTYQNVRLVIIGDANEQSFRELIQSASSLSLSITFTGLSDRESICKWLSIADIGVVPSYYEQFGFVGVEMMMHGLPIIASDGLGVRNMFQDSVNAKIAKIGNRKRPIEYQNNLANAILELLNSPDLCSNLSATARKIYEEKYHIRHMKQKYKELIRSL